MIGPNRTSRRGLEEPAESVVDCAVLPVIGHMSYLARNRRNRNERS